MADDSQNTLVEKIPTLSNIIHPETDEDFLNIYKMQDVHDYIQLILQRYANLTIYVVEPYVEPREGSPLKISANIHYQIHDYGNRIIVAAEDIFTTPLFSTTAFFEAIHQALELLLDAGIQEIAILGDPRAKNFLWDMSERKKTLENRILSVINFSPPEAFGITREAVIRYLKERGMAPSTRPPSATPTLTT